MGEGDRLFVTDIEHQVQALAKKAKAAVSDLARVSTETKREVLQEVARRLRSDSEQTIEAANALDVQEAQQSGLSEALVDRLRLDRERLQGVADAVEQIALFDDPVGSVVRSATRDDGLRIEQRLAPLGLIGIIYESRPNVTVDAAALCFMAGNAVILRGGKEAFRSNRALADVLTSVLLKFDLPPALVTLLPTVDRRASHALLQLAGIVDLVIPRGGPSLIEFVTRESKVPVIQHYKGVCHVYVDADADAALAEKLVVNSKMHRVGVCNAAESLLLDAGASPDMQRKIVTALLDAGAEVRGDSSVQALDTRVVAARDEDWGEEFLAPIIAARVVDGLSGAIAHIGQFGSHHTEAIVTSDAQKAERWFREVDASALMWNASTRFNDGGQLGLGAEIGISTTKLHAYGPMGLNELCTKKWIVVGEGHIRK